MRMKHSAYPPQTGPYIVKVKNGARWKSYQAARLQISVGGERHEGEKFEATIEWVRHRFDKAIVCVNDTLQRFNFMNDGHDECAAYKKSLRAGDAWLARHETTLSRLPGLEVYRWDDWKGDDFIARHEQVLDLYRRDRGFQEAIADGIKNSLSKDYLLEEIAVFSLMHEQCKAVDIYPGTLPKAMSIFKGEHTTRIDFARKKAA
jgi:hypothetical protein